MFTNSDSDEFLYKLVVISDVHHDLERLERLIPVINSADYLIFCGDGVGDIMRERGRITVPILCVRGNNDIGENITELVTTVFGNTRARHSRTQTEYSARSDESDVFGAAKKLSFSVFRSYSFILRRRGQRHTLYKPRRAVQRYLRARCGRRQQIYK